MPAARGVCRGAHASQVSSSSPRPPFFGRALTGAATPRHPAHAAAIYALAPAEPRALVLKMKQFHGLAFSGCKIVPSEALHASSSREFSAKASQW